jgi:acyl-[acyl-carrier-protein]-phospholipid O-acyltransferase / long-chain-fatty-acid--[acyl-carrier-protein] ligase
LKTKSFTTDAVAGKTNGLPGPSPAILGFCDNETSAKVGANRDFGIQPLMTALMRFLLRLLFRLRGYNEAVLKTPGPVLLVPNHTSWFDWLLIGVFLEPDWKFVVSSTSARTSWLHRKIMINRRTFPIDTDSPYAVKRMAEHLQGNGRLVLFAEGRLSRTGALMKLFDGTGFLLHKTNARVITCYLRGAQRLPFCPHPGWRKWFPTVTAHFSEVLTPPQLDHAGTHEARERLTGWLRDRMVDQQFKVEMEFGAHDLPSALVAAARQQPRKIILEDVTHTRLSYRRLLVAADLLAGPLRTALSADAPRVGVLLPNANAVPVTLLSLWHIGKILAVLNYSTSPATMLTCCQLAGLKQVITSRTFLERGRLNLEPLREAGIEFIYLEDLRGKIGGGQKFASLLRMTFNPGSLAESPEPKAASSTPRGDRVAVVLFTSGSEGMPKGVELTHTNILANIRQMLAVTDIMDTDRLFNCLPLFHSFGLTVGLLLPLVRGGYVCVYPSPLHYRVIPVAFYDRDCTIFISTNTFLNGYARKAHPYDFRSMRYLFAAAEKLQEATAITWSQKFGVRIFEGYGATECAPCVSVNVPLAPRYGSVGRLMPGMELKLEPVEGVTDAGRLFVRGPNIMRGYLNADANAAFKALDGWYDTGDIVGTDDDGYLFIRGRLKRFAKVSGEMVSLTAVEDALAGAFPQYGLRCQVAVVARPDEGRGEALIAVTNEPKLQIEEIRAAVKAKGLGNLCVPREIKVVREIPKLGTGKVNHRELAKLL